MTRERRRCQRAQHDGFLSARLRPSVTVFTAAVVLLCLTAWAVQHAIAASGHGGVSGRRLGAVWATTFALLLFQTVLYHLDRPVRVPRHRRHRLDTLHVAILLPAYNEDAGYLRLGLASFLKQTRLPDSVHVVDDGSTSTDYAEVRAWWEQAAASAGIATTWQRVPNGGKRHAQAHGVQASPDAEIYVTVDSDSCLAPNAIEEILKPFARRRVQSVAGVVLATNHKVNMLTRITDLWLVTGQLVDRSAMSATSSVLVNSGPLAAYRATIIRDNLDGYLNETFMGRPVTMSDDSLLTLYALIRGATVQQPSAMVFSAMPEKFGHLQRMYLRWMRGSTIRSIWRMRYLPLNRWAYWAHLLRWFQLALTTSILTWLLVIDPLRHGNQPHPSFLLVPFLIAMGQGLRYLTVVRSDERLWSRIATWLLMPLAVVWAWTFIRALRWYGLITCAKTGWGTRQKGAEVSLTT